MYFLLFKNILFFSLYTMAISGLVALGRLPEIKDSVNKKKIIMN